VSISRDETGGFSLLSKRPGPPCGRVVGAMKRARLLKLGSVLAGALAVGFLALVGWYNASSSGVVREELRRIPSPDGLMDLVVTTTPAGATVSTPYEVFVVRRGSAPAADYAVLRIDKADEPSASWSGPTSALVKCDGARIWHFQNFASIRAAGDDFLHASVKLDCGQ